MRGGSGLSAKLTLDVGPMIPRAFSVQDPTRNESPLLVEVPHAGLYVDPQSLSSLIAPARSLVRDADLYVDELYQDAPAEGATLLVAHVSRYVCDLNRSESDIDAATVDGGGGRAAPHGLVWRTTTDDQPALGAPLPRSELARRLRDFYRPYHAKLSEILQRKRERFGYALLLCAHSMPSRGRAGHADPGRDRADVVPGTRGRTSAAESVIRTVDQLVTELGWTLAHDEPYKGGYSTGHYGRPEEGVHAVQVELARRLYMDEATLLKRQKDFERTQAFCRRLVARLGACTVG
jgi:N-formylglutamate deformylase